MIIASPNARWVSPSPPVPSPLGRGSPAPRRGPQGVAKRAAPCARSVVVLFRASVLVRAFCAVLLRPPAARAAAHPDYPLAPCVVALSFGRA